ncbi:hypothetical protein Golob_013720 [Gossypium lobatum]|uniref:AP2/ERF domain-containing protein n=1 Tax=Gossypium lobatum TaxID=34289 RepID=A0A7J8LQA6_9ROSI|nr:hypothetical protein [Gossypium lobatum]
MADPNNPTNVPQSNQSSQRPVLLSLDQHSLITTKSHTCQNPSPACHGLPPPTPRKANMASASSPSGKHPLYRGIRRRSGKWVSEIREPRKTTRIWLGTYPTPEMAAAAYDVAALALKGAEAFVNFPASVASYPLPASISSADIRKAAAAAALLKKAESNGIEIDLGSGHPHPAKKEEMTSTEEYMDEDVFLNLPNLLVDMAEGLLVSPPRLSSTPSDDLPENSDGESLWSY